MENENKYSMERLAAILQEKGIRPSAQRIAVLSWIVAKFPWPSRKNDGGIRTAHFAFSRPTNILVE